MAVASSRALADQPRATADVAAVVRPHAVGAVLLDRTNMSESALPGLELSLCYGTPCTLADGVRATGGFTSDGATTVAGGMAVAVLGMDIGDSACIPSAFCNLADFKPTARRVSTTGGMPLPTSFGSGDPLVSSANCCATVDAMLSGESGNDAFDTTVVPLAGLRFGITQDYVDTDLGSTVAVAFNHAVEQFERAGAYITCFEFLESLQLPETNSGGGFSVVESWTWHCSLLVRAEAQYDLCAATRVRRSDQVSAAAYVDVTNVRVRMITAAHKCLGNFDA